MKKNESNIPETTTSGVEECFIIMPISDPHGYESGHFRKVYEDIFIPACEKAGYKAKRADDVKATNLIHLDILRRVVESPMAICDLSNRNPNVLFELGLRQAFDKPTVLVQEEGTERIFDISPLRVADYRRTLRYREVLEDQDRITEALIHTKVASKNPDEVLSIVSLLSLSNPASLKDINGSNTEQLFQILVRQINSLQDQMMRANFPNTDPFYEERGLDRYGYRGPEQDRLMMGNTYQKLIELYEYKKYDEARSLALRLQNGLLALLESDQIPEKYREYYKSIKKVVDKLSIELSVIK